MVQSMLGSFVLVVMMGAVILGLCFLFLIVLNLNRARRTSKTRESGLPDSSYDSMHSRERDAF